MIKKEGGSFQLDCHPKLLGMAEAIKHLETPSSTLPT
jgi:hypothetical protein